MVIFLNQFNYTTINQKAQVRSFMIPGIFDNTHFVNHSLAPAGCNQKKVDLQSTLPKDVQADIYARITELLVEEKDYCDKGNTKHMAQILTSIAMYEVLQKHGWSEEDAYRVVSEEMWKFLDPSGIRKLAQKRFFLPLMKKIVPFGFRKGSGYGWRYTWHKDDPKDEFHFERNECI